MSKRAARPALMPAPQQEGEQPLDQYFCCFRAALLTPFFGDDELLIVAEDEDGKLTAFYRKTPRPYVLWRRYVRYLEWLYATAWASRQVHAISVQAKDSLGI